MFYRLLASVVVIIVLAMSSGRAAAQNAELNWAEKMFSDLSIDFGTVARGADTRHRLVLDNLYEEDVRIVNVGTTCGCTAASPDKELLKTHEKANIEVVMDTRKFMHRKDSNVDVTLEFQGAQGKSTKTVRVPITAFIRSDVVLTPGNADFGTIDFGQPSEKLLTVAYAGREDWRIKGIRQGGKHVAAQVVETERGNGRVSYSLTVQLSAEAGIGPIQEKLYLLTDDLNSPEVPVLVTGRVAPDIEILPSEFSLGTLASGEVKQFNVVVKGRRPFAIEGIQCDEHPDCFEIRPPTPEMKTVHVVPFRFTAPQTPGAFAEVFTVTVAGREATLSFAANGTIQAGS